VERESPEYIEPDRRALVAGALAGIGAVALAGCTDPPEPEMGTTSASLTGTSFRWFDIIALLRSSAGTQPGEVAVLEGYAAAGDGGGGLFWWDSTATSPDDSGTVIGASPTGRWKRIHGGTLNVRWFGATPASANPEVGIKRALAVAAASGNGPGYIPAGV